MIVISIKLFCIFLILDSFTMPTLWPTREIALRFILCIYRWQFFIFLSIFALLLLVFIYDKPRPPLCFFFLWIDWVPSSSIYRFDDMLLSTATLSNNKVTRRIPVKIDFEWHALTQRDNSALSWWVSCSHDKTRSQYLKLQLKYIKTNNNTNQEFVTNFIFIAVDPGLSHSSWDCFKLKQSIMMKTLNTNDVYPCFKLQPQ